MQFNNTELNVSRLNKHSSNQVGDFFLRVFSASDGDNEGRAVATDVQGKGVGQALINYALTELKQQQVDVVVSYGDPAFYSKVGFQQIDEARLRSPMPLSMPQGWIAQSLTEQPIPLLTNKPNCVQQFVKPDLW